jgi:hypothetical protein
MVQQNRQQARRNIQATKTPTSRRPRVRSHFDIHNTQQPKVPKRQQTEDQTPP